jgi:hypothetical protein
MPLVAERHSSHTEEAFDDVRSRRDVLQLLVPDGLLSQPPPLPLTLNKRFVLLLLVSELVVRLGSCERPQRGLFNPCQAVGSAAENANTGSLEIGTVDNVGAWSYIIPKLHSISKTSQ